VLAANVIKGCQVTIGADQGTAAAIEQMGGKHVNKNVTVSFQSDVSSPWQQFSVALLQGFMGFNKPRFLMVGGPRLPSDTKEKIRPSEQKSLN